MSVVVIVRKEGEIAIASDRLTSRGSVVLGTEYKVEHPKLIKYHDTWIGCASDDMAVHMIRHALHHSEEEFLFDSVENIYTSMLKLHEILKKRYYLDPKYRHTPKQTVESLNISLLIANSSGIYGVDEDKDIQQFSKFWAAGSGGMFAIGAMYHVYDKYDAAKIAELGVVSACEFDEGSALPIHIETVKEMTCQL
jgi:ATP-dependent protease HslVU (ClpYQ) peptidase subunit